jgi:hypothetical protein
VLRKSVGLLYAPDPLVLARGDELAVADEDRRDVAVIGVDAENVRGLY